MYSRSLAFLSVWAALACAACGRTADAAPAPAGERPPHPVAELPAAEVMRSLADSLLTNVTSLDVDSRGNVYLSDWLMMQVVVLAPDGQVLRTIGREGEGPGEFRRVSSVQVLPGDSVMVHDRALQRVTVFAPGGERVAHVASLRPLHGRTALRVFRARTRPVLLVTYSRPFASWESGKDDQSRHDLLALLDLKGARVADSVLTVPGGGALVRRVNGGVTVGLHPFGREAIVRLTPDDRIAYAWNDTLGAAFYSLDGRPGARFALPARGAPVSDAEFARMERETSKNLLPPLREARPRSWPVMRGMVVDERGRVWVGLNSERGPRSEWASYDAAGRYLGSAFLPSEVTLHAVKNGLAYGVVRDDDGVPSVVVYRITEQTTRT